LTKAQAVAFMPFIHQANLVYNVQYKSNQIRTIIIAQTKTLELLVVFFVMCVVCL